MIFLDSHSEVSPGWLEPILAALVEDKKAIVYPRLGEMTAKTFRHNTPGGGVGTISWNLGFRWLNFCPEQDTTSPIISSAAPGGAWAINSEFYHAIGGLEKGMTGWGGEDVELSLRVQLCAGGNIKGIPCSYVYHLYKEGHPYNITSQGYAANIKTISHLYIHENHRDIPCALLNCLDYQLTPKQNDELEKMKESRKEMKCKSFDDLITRHQSYMTLPDRDDQCLGMLQNSGNQLCINMSGTFDNDGYERLTLERCCLESPQFTITKYGQIKRLGRCMTLNNEEEMVLANCSDIEKKMWMKDSFTRIYHFDTGKCLGGIRDEHEFLKGRLAIDTCTENSPDVQWKMDYYLHWEE